jgi:hypothetical protein
MSTENQNQISAATEGCAAAAGYVAWLLWCYDTHSTLNMDTLIRAYAHEGDARAECEQLNEAEMDSYSYGISSISVNPHTVKADSPAKEGHPMQADGMNLATVDIDREDTPEMNGAWTAYDRSDGREAVWAIIVTAREALKRFAPND